MVMCPLTTSMTKLCESQIVESAAAVVVWDSRAPTSLSSKTSTPSDEIAKVNGSDSRLAQGAHTMPIYTCTVAESTLAADTKRALAVEIARMNLWA